MTPLIRFLNGLSFFKAWHSHRCCWLVCLSVSSCFLRHMARFVPDSFVQSVLGADLFHIPLTAETPVFAILKYVTVLPLRTGPGVE